MNMKRIQLKEAIKQIVRQAINERKSMIREEAPPGKRAERAVMHIKKSLRDKHPEWDDEKITSVAIATAWKLHNKGSLEEDDKAPKIKKGRKLGLKLKQEAGLTSENGNYSEEAELELIKQIGQKVLELLAMHGAGNSTNEPEDHEPEVSDTTPDPFEEPEDIEVSDDDDDSGEEVESDDFQDDPKVSENHKVQTGPSYRTARDCKDNPKNVRNPKLG